MTYTSREAVERLLQDVTPGPWEYEAGDPLSSVSTSVDGRYTGIAYLSLPNHAANARFIAAARYMVPALLARAEAAEADLRASKISEVFWRDGWHALDQDKRAIEAKLVKALRSALNFVEKTESEMGVILGCGDKARATLRAIEEDK